MLKNSKNMLVAILIAIILIQTKYIFSLKNDLKKLTKEPTTSLPKTLSDDYIQISDSSLLRDKPSYYTVPYKDIQETVPDKLKQFIIKNYYLEKNDAAESNICLKSADTCPLDKINFQMLSIDLNEDGIKEYIVFPIKICGCMMRGASGNGDILVLQSNGATPIVIGELLGNSYVLSRNKTNGYKDILTNYHNSAATGVESLYQFHVISNGMTSNRYDQTFTKWYDTSRSGK